MRPDAAAGGRADHAARAFNRFAIPALVLIPWLILGGLLLTMLHAQQRAALQSAAALRATVAAEVLDGRISDVIKSAGSLRAPSQNGTDPATVASTDLHGVRFRTWNSSLVRGAPAATEDSGADELDLDGQSAVKSALSAKEPQVTSFIDSGGSGGGVNLWLPLFKDGEDPVVLQVLVPASFLSDSVKHLDLGNGSILSALDTAGADLVALTARDARGSSLRQAADGLTTPAQLPPGNFVTALSEKSPLGLQVRAAIPLATMDAQQLRNWSVFVFVTLLLAAATLLGKRWITGTEASTMSDRKSEMLMPTHDSGQSRGLLYRTSSPIGRSAGERGGARQGVPAASDSSGERLRDALDAGGICAWEWRRASTRIVWTTSYADLLRCAPDMPPPTVRALLRRLFPHERRRLLHAARIALAEGRPLSIDVRLTRFDGEQRWVAIRAKPVSGTRGVSDGFIGIAYDVTDQKRGLSRTDTLLREVSHRSKNMLALILAMARLTARDAVDVKSHLKQFALRVSGLAASQDLIVAADWQNVDFGTLAAAQIDAVARTEAPRVKISGPTLLVNPEAAQTLGMILTEFTLNAIEHGALSTAGGDAHLSWSFPDAATVKISWRESGGPAFDSARPKGYGMSVVERFSTQGLKLESRIVNDGKGVTWVLEGPLTHIGMRSPPPA